MTTVDQYDSAVARAEQRFNIGEKAEEALLHKIAEMVIRDKLVAPKAMDFLADESAGGKLEIRLRYANDQALYTIHRHALGQLAGRVEFPIVFANKLMDGKAWKADLLAHNLNTLFHNTQFERGSETPRFLHRIVGTEIRGFLSRRFNRQLASLPLLRAFVEATKQVGAKPIEVTTTDLRWSLKSYLPQVFEAFPGQYICVGVAESNSDFGAGKLSITQTIWDPMRDTRTVLDEGISKVHLGSVLEDSDIEMGEDTAASEVETQAMAIRDAVNTYLSVETVDRALKTVKAAHEAEIPWKDLKSQLSRILYDKEVAAVETLLNSPDIVDLPPVGKTASGDPLPTRWWAAQVITSLAKNENDERKMELQQQAGKMLAGS